MTRLRNVAEQSIEHADDPAAARDALETCLEESDNALTLLRSLTEIAEAETGALPLNLETIRVADVAAHVAGLYEFVAEERNITLHTSSIPDTLAVRADRARFQQILANLVDNAVKYSPDNTTVTVRAGETTGDGMVAISVTDEGPGIPAADLPRIWERLYRGDASRSSAGSKPGLGLGLSLVRAVAEAHGGSATAESTAGSAASQGSTFTLTLPAVAWASSP